jgi:hypothetical protein
MTVVSFQVGTKIVTGHGSVSRIGAELTGVGARRVAVVADRGVAEVGLLDRILTAAGAMQVVSTTRSIRTPMSLPPSRPPMMRSAPTATRCSRSAAAAACARRRQ